jgi:phosphoglycerate dehydrogenase-like enzyme
VAGATVESGQRIFSMAIEDIARVLSNQTALYRV